MRGKHLQVIYAYASVVGKVSSAAQTTISFSPEQREQSKIDYVNIAVTVVASLIQQVPQHGAGICRQCA